MSNKDLHHTARRAADLDQRRGRGTEPPHATGGVPKLESPKIQRQTDEFQRACSGDQSVKLKADPGERIADALQSGLISASLTPTTSALSTYTAPIGAETGRLLARARHARRSPEGRRTQQPP